MPVSVPPRPRVQGDGRPVGRSPPGVTASGSVSALSIAGALVMLGILCRAYTSELAEDEEEDEDEEADRGSVLSSRYARVVFGLALLAITTYYGTISSALSGSSVKSTSKALSW